MLVLAEQRQIAGWGGMSACNNNIVNEFNY